MASPEQKKEKCIAMTWVRDYQAAKQVCWKGPGGIARWRADHEQCALATESWAVLTGASLVDQRSNYTYLFSTFRPHNITLSFGPSV